MDNTYTSDADVLVKPAIATDESTKIQIENDRTGMSVETLKRAFLDNLFYLQGISQSEASNYDYYVALAYTIRDRLLHRFLKTVETYRKTKSKLVCYLSAEFLMGRYLGNNLINLGLYEKVQQVLEELDIDLDTLLEQEPDPGLGNGGLGRLAACFLDSLASLEIPAVGYGIRYEFGIFHQKIQDGWQVEVPDNWLRFRNPWELPRPDETVEVMLGGHTEVFHDERGYSKVVWIPERTILAIPYDSPVPGYQTNTVNPLRLWKAEASADFDFDAFNAGQYDRAVAEKMDASFLPLYKT
jgi:glycogen phosphorylase